MKLSQDHPHDDTFWIKPQYKHAHYIFTFKFLLQTTVQALQH